MNTTADFFYGGALRWSFGFENPNKAAVIFVCLLPLFFLLWDLGWKLQKAWWLKAVVLAAAGLLVLGDGLCLFKTYSRGGVAAAAVAVVYFLFRTWWGRRSVAGRPLFRSVSFYATGGLVGLLLGLFVWVGLGERSLEPVTSGDASVSNRLVLWRSALQMAVENPAGFGTGKSGEAYMQWYQPVASENGYRTMVNSYLTFLVEQGWLWFAVVLTVAGVFWWWARPGRTGSTGSVIATGLRASLLAFMVSGVFSTIMEEPRLWILPILCLLALTGWSLMARVPFVWSRAGAAVVLVLVLLAGLYLGGLVQSQADPLLRQFSPGPEGRGISELALKAGVAGAKTWTVVPDAEVLGPAYGKLLRQLVVETGVMVKLRRAEDRRDPADRLLLTGKAVRDTPVGSSAITILLTPAAISPSAVPGWLSSSPRLIVLVPSIDEDRRGHFWRVSVPATSSPRVTLTTLEGVGLRVDWDWEEVIRLIKSS